IDGKIGRLSYRGYDIHDLGGHISFEECVHLLQRGTLPTRAQLDTLTADLAANRDIGSSATAVMEYVIRSGTPMEALRTLVSSLSIDDPDAADSSPEANQRKALRLVAQLPVLIARYQAARTGGSVPDPDPDLGIAGNFLLQIIGTPPSER